MSRVQFGRAHGANRKTPLAWPLGALLCLALALLLSPAASAAQQEGAGRYIVVLQDSTEHPGRVTERHAENRGAGIVHVYRDALKGYAAEIERGELAAIEADPTVAYVEHDYFGGIAAQTTPTGIDRIFATANKGLQINEEDDFRVDVDVAVFDTAIDANHADLDVVGQVNCHKQACKEEESAGGGHGTHVAGTIAAIDNGVGVVGVAPGARLWSVRVLSPGGFGNLSDLIAGIDWVTATREDEDPGNDIEVTNASLRYWNEVSSEAFNKALKASIEVGIVHVAAAGNEAETVKYIPGNNSEEITVSALADYDGEAGGGASPTCENYGLDDRLASFSNFGSIVDVAAPGVCILSTWAGGGYETISGTSMASPHVAGAAAILAANEKPESKADVEAIRTTILEEGNLNWTDTSGDGLQEPLLDVSDEAVFSLFLAPAVSTQAATEIGTATATLNAAVNPRGSETSYQFEYGTTTEYGSKVPASPESIGAGSEAVAVDEPIEGLKQSTTYHFRVVATNAHGTSKGQDLEFTTAGPPSATTKAASGLSAKAATLNATVNPNGLATTYQFEYGKTTAYGSKVPLSPKSIGSGSSPVEVSEGIAGLEPEMTYHFRVVATSAAGTTHGEDGEFKTTPPSWSALYPSGGASTESWLGGIACSAPNDCVAVGGREDPEGEGRLAMAQKWDGSAWSMQSPPMPAGSSRATLSDVSCPLSEACIATGVYTDDESQVRHPLAEIWDGSKWSLHSVPQPEGAGYANLEGVACTAADDCMAVGSHSEETGGGGPSEWHAARWDGSEWSLSTIPQPEEATETSLGDISCTTAASCVAVGSATIGGVPEPRAAVWDGSTWSTQALPLPEGALGGSLVGISCLLEEGCVAVGSAIALEQESLTVSRYAVEWNGSEWSLQAVQAPEGSALTYFRGVSCISIEGCIGVGYEANGAGEWWPAIHRWDGTEWTPDALPEPEVSKHGALNDVSCTALKQCMAVGDHEYNSLAEVLG